MTSLNPLARIGKQIAEAVLLHRPVPPEATRARVIELLNEVGVPDAAHRLLALRGPSPDGPRSPPSGP